jgi:hypothetical protein
MRLFIAASTALILSSAVAFAGSDPMAARYGNTVVAKTKDGVVAHMYYNPDHSFTGRVISTTKGMQDFKLKGTWRVLGDKVCVTYDPPPPGLAAQSCYPQDNYQVGSTWISGDTTVTLVQGIQ